MYMKQCSFYIKSYMVPYGIIPGCDGNGNTNTGLLQPIVHTPMQTSNSSKKR